MQYFGTGRWATHRSIAYSSVAGTVSTAVADGIQKVRIYVTTDAYVTYGKSVTASTTSVPMPAFAPEYVTVSPGEVVSAVQVTTGGTLHVTDVT